MHAPFSHIAPINTQNCVPNRSLLDQHECAALNLIIWSSFAICSHVFYSRSLECFAWARRLMRYFRLGLFIASEDEQLTRTPSRADCRRRLSGAPRNDVMLQPRYYYDGTNIEILIICRNYAAAKTD